MIQKSMGLHASFKTSNIVKNSRSSELAQDQGAVWDAADARIQIDKCINLNVDIKQLLNIICMTFMNQCPPACLFPPNLTTPR